VKRTLECYGYVISNIKSRTWENSILGLEGWMPTREKPYDLDSHVP
jgi:hypothetical protein